MNKKIIYIILAIVLILGAIAIVSATRQPNDYIAFVFPIEDFNPTNEDTLSIQYPVGYVPITGSKTYTYTRANLITEINLSTPSTINSRMRTTIIDYGISQGYNIKSIIYQDYNVVKVNP